MNLLYEMNKERGVTVLIPTEMASSMGTLIGAAQAIADPLAAPPPPPPPAAP